MYSFQHVNHTQHIILYIYVYIHASACETTIILYICLYTRQHVNHTTHLKHIKPQHTILCIRLYTRQHVNHKQTS